MDVIITEPVQTVLCCTCAAALVEAICCCYYYVSTHPCFVHLASCIARSENSANDCRSLFCFLEPILSRNQATFPPLPLNTDKNTYI